ncbi:MAG: DnaB-like helicase C-terminal domain-containing protein [bacterium]
MSEPELYDRQAERCLLGRLLLEPEHYLKVHDRLDPEDFYFREHKETFVAFQAVYLRDGKVELPAVLEELKGTDVSFVSLSATMEEAELYRATDWPLRRVLALSNKRRLQTGLLRIGQSIGAKEEGEICQDLLDLAIATRREKGRVFNGSELADLGFFLMEQRRERGGNPIQGFRTGFETVDFHTTGLQGRRLTLISGPTGHGKSGVAVNWFASICILGEIPGLYITTEMREQDVLDRAVGILSGQELRTIESGRVNQAIGEALERIRNSPFHVSDNASRNVHDAALLIEKYAVVHGIRIWCLDYIGRLDRDNPKLDEMRDERFARWVKSLWNVTQRHDLHGVIVSQVNAQQEIAESKKIEHEADHSFFFKREGKRHILECRKNRFGPVGYRYLIDYDRRTQRMREHGILKDRENEGDGDA